MTIYGRGDGLTSSSTFTLSLPKRVHAQIALLLLPPLLPALLPPQLRLYFSGAEIRKIESKPCGVILYEKAHAVRLVVESESMKLRKMSS